MVKTYIKYEQSQAFGVISSATSNLVWTSETSGANAIQPGAGVGRAYVGANEDVLCWDVKKGELVSKWRDETSNAVVTALAQSQTDKEIFAAGYDDGSIRIWDSRIASIIMHFNGHKSAVTSLSFDYSGVRLASGAKDTDIIIWDLVSETGLYKLRGHKDQITALQFMRTTEDETEDDSEQIFLMSTSKDSLIKIWDVVSQHCIETHVAHANGECWALALSPDGSSCMTAGNDGELKVWSIYLQGLRQAASQVVEGNDQSFLSERGTMYRHSKERTTCVSFHPSGEYIAAHGLEKNVEIWRIRSTEEVQKSLARKRRRKREKDANAAGEEKMDGGDGDADKQDITKASISEVIVPHVVVRTGGKVRSIAWMTTKTTAKDLPLLTNTTNNCIESFNIISKSRSKKGEEEDVSEYTRTFAVDLPGHRTDIRCIALSSDDRMLATAASGSLKIWNVRSQACLRTLECGYALCCAFLPGDKIVVVGTKAGELELFDIASSMLIDRVVAHEGPVWSLQVHPDGKSVATGSADKSAKFWTFDVVQEEVPGTRRTSPRLKLVHSRTVKVNDDILSVCFSPDSRLFAVATLDNTVKVFFTDSLKLFLNLYGHKLPVLNMSISSDSKLIATCSADKNVRIWGLDFGDCHKAFFAHNDSVMQVAFIPHPVGNEEAHYLFSASKDRGIKTWDGDKFQQIQRIQGHHGEIWALAVSRTGDFFVTASHDKSIRVWVQSDEPIFLEEERERELEEAYEATLTKNLELDEDGMPADDDAQNKEVAAATKQTIATLTAGERIAEALELGIADLELVRTWEAQKAANPTVTIAPPQRNPLFIALGNLTAERHVLNTISKVPAAQLQDALLVLPFSLLPSLFTFIGIWIDRQWSVGLVCRVFFFMLKTHQRQIVASRELKALLETIKGQMRKALGETKDLVGVNLAALHFLHARVRDAGIARLEDFQTEEETAAAAKKKRAFVDVA